MTSRHMRAVYGHREGIESKRLTRKQARVISEFREYQRKNIR